MSADNYMLVRKTNGGTYLVTMEFASSNVAPLGDDLDNSRGRIFNTFGEASAYAEAEASGVNDDFGYGCEYGVVYDVPTRVVEVDG